MNDLDNQIQAVLKAASDLPDNGNEPNLTDEILSTFRGRHSWLMKWGVFKMVIAAVMMLVFAYLFFQQESTMAMIAYASLTLMCVIAYAAVFLFIWVQMNHNTTVREIKRLELQIVLLTRALKDPDQT